MGESSGEIGDVDEETGLGRGESSPSLFFGRRRRVEEEESVTIDEIQEIKGGRPE